MKRAYYSNTIELFIKDSVDEIIGKLTINHTNNNLSDLQVNAWKKQIETLQNQLLDFSGYIYFEFSIPRMGKRVDNIVIINDKIFVIEFKVGDNNYSKHAVEQVIDYTVDLKNFHEGSHNTNLIPILIATEANKVENDLNLIKQYYTAFKANKTNIRSILNDVLSCDNNTENKINIEEWENSIYKPTPTIVEAAQALYKGHNVKEITRSDAGAINLSKTANCINDIIEKSKKENLKSICFVTGVPGAGKTLAGLNIANDRMNADENEHAVFLSGNGPLVEVLREALTRDEVYTAKKEGVSITKRQAAIKANAFIQNIHHFRDDNLKSDRAPIEKVVVFDEAQRAWTKEQLNSFMKQKKGIENFNMSEPEFLINIMDRHSDWCTIVCLIGGGQEINTGEAGIQEWGLALKNKFPEWNVFYSNLIIEDDNYLKIDEVKKWLTSECTKGRSEKDLHLAVSLRSFRSERLSDFVHSLLDLKTDFAKKEYDNLKSEYPIVITRNLNIAKKWLKEKAKGTERIGIIASSGARRLKADGIDVKNDIKATNWFLNDSDDVRSSYFMEDIMTEFGIQGLEIDWACLAWGANFYYENEWKHKRFKGTKWQNINSLTDKMYLKNTYRVLLTRARQGMVIYIPEGSSSDKTRLKAYYDGTYEYLKSIGIEEIFDN